MAYELGLALKVRRLTVTDDHTELLSQVVDEFLQLSAPTWATIVEALRSPAVKCDKLATEVEKRFCTEPPTGPAKGIVLVQLLRWNVRVKYLRALRNYSYAYLELRRTLRYGSAHIYIRKIGPLTRLGQLARNKLKLVV